MFDKSGFISVLRCHKYKYLSITSMSSGNKLIANHWDTLKDLSKLRKESALKCLFGSNWLFMHQCVRLPTQKDKSSVGAIISENVRTCKK